MSSNKLFTNRYWVRSSQSYELDSFGYLADPEGTETLLTPPRNAHLTETSALAQKVCCVLLGEPGMGKSYELEALYRQSEQLDPESNLTLHIDLRGSADFAEVREHVVDAMIFEQWRTGSQVLHLYLDSLDECALRIGMLNTSLSQFIKEHFDNTLLSFEEWEHLIQPAVSPATSAQLVANQDTKVTVSQNFTAAVDSDAVQLLRRVSREGSRYVHVDVARLSPEVRARLPVALINHLEAQRLLPRLRLTLTCRTSDWESGFSSLRDVLAKLWDEDFRIFTLTPLRRTDMIEAATRSSLDSKRFLETVEKGVVALAIKPQRLKMLLNLFAAEEELTNDLVALYRQTCLYSCSNAGYQPSRGQLDAEERLAIAARIAAVSVLSLRGQIFVQADSELRVRSSSEIGVADFTGFHETVKGNRIEVREASVREVLSTGLFRSAGKDGYLTVEHQSVAEFLAAYYLSTHGLTPKQRLDVVLHPDDQDGWVTPQLRETALWLARMDEDVLELLLERDPNLLLQTDLELSEPQRKRLVDKLLLLIGSERLSPASIWEQPRYERLNHPGIADQLRPFIEDTEQSDNTRRAAVEMARASDPQALKRELLVIALDPDQDRYLRTIAVIVLSDIADTEIRHALRPLALDQLPGDDDDELRGIALRAVWPEALSLDELLGALRPPQDYGLWGSYKSFVDSNDLWQAIEPSQMPQMLKFLLTTELWNWLVRAGFFHKGLEEFFARVLDHLDDQAVLDPLARLIWRELNTYHHDLVTSEKSRFAERLQQDETVRRTLLTHLVEETIPEHETAAIFGFRWQASSVLWRVDDFEWFLHKWSTCPEGIIKTRWLDLLEMIFDVRNEVQKNALHARSSSEPLLATLVDNAEKSLRRVRQFEEERKAEELAERAKGPNPEKVVRERLTRAEEDPRWWWVLERDLTLVPGSTHYQDDLEPDISKLTGWQTADEELRARIVRVAKAFIELDEFGNEAWIGSGQMNLATIAGYKALRIILKREPEYLDRISSAIWNRWAPIVVTYPNIGNFTNEDYSLDHKLLELAYARVPERCLEVIGKDIDHDLVKRQGAFILSRLKTIWDERICALLLGKVKSRWQQGQAVEGILRELVEQGYEPARSLAERWLVIGEDASDALRQRAVVAATALLSHTEDASWAKVYPLFASHPELGEEVALRSSDGYITQQGSVQSRLGASQAADLYLWLDEHFPPEQDNPYPSGIAHYVTPRDSVARWRDAVLTDLQERGNQEAVQALERVLQERPDYTWLNWTIRKARENARRNTWKPLLPGRIIELAARPDARLIRGPEQLLELLVESLQRLDAALQGETPTAPLLWNKLTKTKYRPKDEESLSDLLRWYLETDLRGRGLNLTREPVIRRGEGANRGERLDVLVDLENAPNTGVIIEVKGCWNKDLWTAMEKQLTGRYLEDNPGRYGLYVVGWFLCDQWDTEDFRRKQTPKLSLDEARVKLETQVRQLELPEPRVKAFVLNASLR